MECLVCSNTYNKGTIRATPCGHIFHENCLIEWLNKKRAANEQGNCPTCRKTVDMAKTLVIFLGDDSMDKQFLETKINNIEEQNKIIIERNSILESILDEQNRALKREIMDLKELMMTNMNFNDPSTVNVTEGQQNELLRAKDTLIANLKKEIHDLKVQRADMAKNLSDIQKEVSELKNRQFGGGAARAPLLANAARAPISLSLKFDDLSNLDKADRLIFED